MKRQVLQSFKSLHKAGKVVFEGDLAALEKVRLKINDEYKKNKNLRDKTVIDEKIKFSKEVEKELRSSVIQAVEVAPGKYEAKIRSETIKLDNIPFKETCEMKVEKT
ncbi:complex III assembly factor LYRM7 [Coccinella septempunctata]|uniref:complex III assembly factor LYRM7 n=1 Tax=Coccinella septempunctata TaxID=41139 RepID=UPI001D072A21|nr:complex III assembly factor LYRM7 [Coccinella septempunctata]